MIRVRINHDFEIPSLDSSGLTSEKWQSIQCIPTINSFFDQISAGPNKIHSVLGSKLPRFFPVLGHKLINPIP